MKNLKAFASSTEKKNSYHHKFVKSPKNHQKVPPDFSGDRGGRVLRTKIFKTLLPEAILMIRNIVEDSKRAKPTPDEESQSICIIHRRKILSP